MSNAWAWFLLFGGLGGVASIIALIEADSWWERLAVGIVWLAISTAGFWLS